MILIGDAAQARVLHNGCAYKYMAEAVEASLMKLGSKEAELFRSNTSYLLR